MSIEQRVKRIIKQTENDLLKTIEQDCRLITALKTQRDGLLDACTKVASVLECLRLNGVSNEPACTKEDCCCVCECQRVIAGIVKGF